jgi:hypothetical protein
MPQPIEPFTLPIEVKLNNGLTTLRIDEQGCATFRDMQPDGFWCQMSPALFVTLCKFLGGGNGIALTNRIEDLRKPTHEREENTKGE